jgi:hypothetical protein
MSEGDLEVMRFLGYIEILFEDSRPKEKHFWKA